MLHGAKTKPSTLTRPRTRPLARPWEPCATSSLAPSLTCRPLSPTSRTSCPMGSCPTPSSTMCAATCTSSQREHTSTQSNTCSRGGGEPRGRVAVYACGIGQCGRQPAGRQPPCAGNDLPPGTSDSEQHWWRHQQQQQQRAAVAAAGGQASPHSLPGPTAAPAASSLQAASPQACAPHCNCCRHGKAGRGTFA
jgi:hypothetical protein